MDEMVLKIDWNELFFDIDFKTCFEWYRQGIPIENVLRYVVATQFVHADACFRRAIQQKSDRGRRSVIVEFETVKRGFKPWVESMGGNLRRGFLTAIFKCSRVHSAAWIDKRYADSDRMAGEKLTVFFGNDQRFANFQQSNFRWIESRETAKAERPMIVDENAFFALHGDAIWTQGADDIRFIEILVKREGGTDDKGRADSGESRQDETLSPFVRIWQISGLPDRHKSLACRAS